MNTCSICLEESDVRAILTLTDEFGMLLADKCNCTQKMCPRCALKVIRASYDGAELERKCPTCRGWFKAYILETLVNDKWKKRVRPNLGVRFDPLSPGAKAPSVKEHRNRLRRIARVQQRTRLQRSLFQVDEDEEDVEYLPPRRVRPLVILQLPDERGVIV